MVHGDNASEVNATQESEEIDRIMQQIEDLEKKMEQAAPSAEHTGESPKETSSSALGNAVDNVVSLRAETPTETTDAPESSLVESDASPVSDQPLLASQNPDGGNGSLALKVGGCTDISLEFEREGVTIHLACTSEGLTISTDQGAEFRLPFKRLAA